ncbi:amidohydrolase family protein [Actinomadura hibisca]|uniref:amidohydrolase family protein n=1 Tax=Actinomadura hibisca TaxID=68565 RepID=UPI000835F993|nr:amidohydrolase family protein [Actinomadura hibisca]
MRIDAHHHLWDTAVREYGWMDGDWADPLRGRFDAARYATAAGPHGVAASVVVQALQDEAETRDLLAVADRDATVAAVVGWVDLTAPDVAAALAGLAAGPGGRRLAGVRHLAQDEPDPFWLLRADVLRGVRAVGAAGLAYDVLVRRPQWGTALEFARRLPEVPLVLDHAGKPGIAAGEFAPWATWIEDMATLRNVTVKLSGLVTEAADGWRPADVLPYAHHVLETFGPGRVMFGSDWPVCTLAGTYEQVTALAEEACATLDETGRAAVFGGTAQRVYALPR